MSSEMLSQTSPVDPRPSPTGPRGHWLFGVMPQVRRDALALYSRAWREHGDVARYRAFPGVYFFHLVHPDAVEHVLQKNARNYRRTDVFTGGIRLLGGNGLLTSDGAVWLRQRRLIQPVFLRQHLVRLSGLMGAGAEGFVRERETATDQPVDMLGEMMRLTLRIAGTTLFGADLTGEAAAVGRAARVVFDYIGRKMTFKQLLPAWVPTAANRRFRRARQELQGVVDRIIADRRRSGADPGDLLSLLLAARDEDDGTGMTDRQLRDESLTLLAAGHETTGTALAWTWLLLGQHPEIQEAVGDEVRGRLQGRNPTADDLPHLPLTRAVFEEAMRLYPPAWGMTRQAIAADEIGGVPIPAGTVIALVQYFTHRHPDFWDEPERFNPERFLPGRGEGRHRFAYFPFGGGPRVCIGNHFALMEGPLVLATLAQRFRIELVPNQDFTPDPTFTLRPRHGVKVWLRPR